MRILLAHSQHSARGGADKVMEQEQELLREAGHEARQYVAADAGSTGQPAWRQAADAVWNNAAYRALRQEIRSFRPDVLHVHTPFPVLSPAAFRAASAEGIPAVTTVHSYRYSCIAGTLRRDGRICEDCVGSQWKTSGLRHGCYHGRAASAAMTTSLVLHHRSGTFKNDVSRFLTLTEFARAVLVRDGIPADRVVVKPNFVEDPGHPVDYARRDPIALFAGRLVPEKGITTLLEAWRGARGSGARLVIVGDGPLREVVERAAGDDPSIDFRGWQTPEEVGALQARSRLTVVCSEWYEGQPLVLLDALAHGTPLVVSDLDNLSSSVLAAGAGLSFRTGDPGSLGEALSAVLGDPGHAAAMGSRARDLYLRAHTPSAILADLERIYGEVIAESHP
ncbi:glycosyltransferase family 4 protein [Nocardioides mesophilus]|uniref:Glycosyltransferase family 4 protein n=1 Tax=Nocardioides mesophilus TaxID=433659 RepID=A0A7G9REK6_9ACTN|nr:glycosyltransferase family 4 protein [Nocardioides mesophilus]QNN54031.1 glycosyltransferase family 4 protein [Nocardioides mesophilus]